MRSNWLGLTFGVVLTGGVIACGASDDSRDDDAGRVISELTTNGVNVTLSLQSDWGAGYCANVTLQNTSANPVTSWSVLIELNGSQLSNAWNATTSVSGSRLTATALGYNSTIAPNASVGFGFCAASASATSRPTIVSSTITGGGVTGTGGSSSGGSGGGGSANGGSSSGGSGSGGASSGGSANGGSSNGGSGGASSGGSASGGSGSGGGSSSGGSASGGSGAGGSGGSGTGGSAGSGGTGSTMCDPGTTTTTWASSCPTSAPACTAGTWVAGGPDPDHSSFKLIKESAHFAIYSDETIADQTAQGALDTLENTIWKTYFGAPIYFKEPLCNQSNKIKASVHVHSDYGLTGGAWSATRMGMWIGPGALADHWGLAHEFMHAVQSVSGGMSCNQSNTCGWIYESHANFMPHQLSEYRSEVHCSEMLVNAPHVYLGSTRDRYCNWQFMEYLKDKYCYSAVNDIWTSSPNSDPFSQIMKTRGWSISQLNDFFGEWAMHNVTWDYQNPAPTGGGNQGATYRQKYGSIMDKSRPERRVRETMLEPLDASYATSHRFVTPSAWAPQRWGYSIVRLYPTAGATSVKVTFRGVVQSGADSDFRWGLVATDSAITKPRYSPLQKGVNGALEFCVGSGEALFLVVTATPSVQKQIVWDQAYNTVYRYPWMIELANAWPDGFKNGALDACASGARHSNGNGCVVGSVPSSVYVGPYAQVLGGALSGTARIEDHAVVLSGATVSGGTVTGLSVLTNGFSVSGSAKAGATFYPLGFFEGGQSISGTAQLLGDVEYRGQGTNKSSGTYFGFVEPSTGAAGNTADVTVAGPYTWRP
jgi:hypothetical protein